MTDIFLYPGEASPNDVRLRDPTLAGQSIEVTSWLAPLSTPMLRAFLIAQTALFAVPLVEATVDKWMAPLSAPIVRQRAPQAAAFWPGFVPAAETTTVDRWFSPLSPPIARLRGPTPDNFYWSTFTPSGAVETITMDKWYAPLVHNIVPRRSNQQQAFWLGFVPASETITLDKWHAPLSIPAPRVRPPGAICYFWSGFALENIGLNWFQPLSLPGRLSARSLQGETFAPLLASPPAMTAWFACLSVPPARRQLAGQQAFWIDPVALTLPSPVPTSPSIDPKYLIVVDARVRIVEPMHARIAVPIERMRTVQPSRQRTITLLARIQTILDRRT